MMAKTMPADPHTTSGCLQRQRHQISVRDTGNGTPKQPQQNVDGKPISPSTSDAMPKPGLPFDLPANAHPDYHADATGVHRNPLRHLLLRGDTSICFCYSYCSCLICFSSALPQQKPPCTRHIRSAGRSCRHRLPVPKHTSGKLSGA